MPTPNTYDIDHFKDLISNSGNIFHQTSIKNLPNILQMEAIYSPGTLWGLDSTTANSFYMSNHQRSDNLRSRADKGFIDYVFCSFKNGVELSNKRYGTVSIEIRKEVLLEKECFIYPFNFVFAWDSAPKSEKFSDLSIWDLVISGRKRIRNEEILVRRKINLPRDLVKFHCFDSMQSKVVEILKNFNYDESKLEIHSSALSLVGGFNMNREMIAEINGIDYHALVSDDGKLANIFNFIDEDDSDFRKF